MIDEGLDITDLLLLGTLVLVLSNYVFFLGSAVWDLWSFRARSLAQRTVAGMGSDVLPPVTILAPMYNESGCIVEAARSLLSTRYPRLELLLVNDGSGDETLQRLTEAYGLKRAERAPTASIPSALIRGIYQSQTNPSMWVLDKENGGRSDAVNAGIAHCKTPLVCIVDADGILEPDALMRMVVPFMTSRETVAVGGNVRIANGCRIEDGVLREVSMPKTWIERFQVLEYMRAFLVARMGWSAADMLLIISGAFGLYRRDMLAELGGLDTGTIGEDMELTIRLHRYYRERKERYRIEYIPDAVCWTESPSTYHVLGKQRDRWHRGLTEILVKHRSLLFNPRYGRIGLFGMPYYLMVEWLGPIIETIGYGIAVWAIFTGWINWQVAIWLGAVALLFGMGYSFAVIAVDESTASPYKRWREFGLLMLASLFEHLGYRQMTVYYRLRGIWKYIRGDNSWGTMTRTGF